jgi:hypothetical protein
MAHNGFQLHTTAEAFYRSIRQPCNTGYGWFDKLEMLSSWLNDAEASDYSTIGVDAADITRAGQFRSAINTFLAAQSTIDFRAVMEDLVRP